jgi:hypothetical protein
MPPAPCGAASLKKRLFNAPRFCFTAENPSGVPRPEQTPDWNDALRREDESKQTEPKFAELSLGGEENLWKTLS